MKEIKIYDSKQTVAEEFSVFFKELAASHKTFNVALSGGSTPKIVFDYLAENFEETIDWSRINFYWGDERCVLPTDEESNYKMTVTHLLSKVAVPEANIFRVQGENDPISEAVRYGAVLAKNLPNVDGVPKFDLVILGMGDDGHTASIFPHEIELWDATENCEVAIHPDSGQKRITLTGKVINNAAVVAFLVTGGSKAEKVKEILNEVENYRDYPATLVKPTTGDLVWFLDADAAKEIN